MSDPLSPDNPAAMDSGSPAAAPVKPAADWEDFVDIFYAPSQVFARREHSGFVVPMLVVTVLSAVIFYAAFNAMSPIIDAEFSRASANAIRKGATPEMMEKGRAIGEKLMKVTAVVVPPLAIALTGLLLWAFGKFVGARQTLTAAVMVAAYAYVPRLVGTLLGAVQAMVMDPAQLTSRHAITFSAARFMDPDTSSPVLLAVAGHLELFILWSTVLLAIGLAVTGRIPRSRAALAAGLVWVFTLLPELLSAARQ